MSDNRTIKRRLSSLYRFIAVLCVLYRLVHSTVHSAEHTVQCSASCTYITVHCTEHIRHSALVQSTVHSAEHITHCGAVHTSQCTVLIAQCTVHSTVHTHHSALSTEHRAQCRAHYTLWCTAQCTHHSALSTEHSAQCRAHYTLWCSAQCTLITVHSVESTLYGAMYMCVGADDKYQSLSNSCARKRAAVRQLKLQMHQLEVQRMTSHQRIDSHVQELVVSFTFNCCCSLLNSCFLLRVQLPLIIVIDCICSVCSCHTFNH